MFYGLLRVLSGFFGWDTWVDDDASPFLNASLRNQFLKKVKCSYEENYNVRILLTDMDLPLPPALLSGLRWGSSFLLLVVLQYLSVPPAIRLIMVSRNLIFYAL